MANPNDFWGSWFGKSVAKPSSDIGLQFGASNPLGQGTKKSARKNIEDYVNPAFIANNFKSDPLGAIGGMFTKPLAAPTDVFNSLFGRDEPKYPWDNLPGGREQYLANAQEQNKTNYWSAFLTKNQNLSGQGSSQELSSALSEGVPRLALSNPKLASQLGGRIQTILTAREHPGRRQTILANPLQRI